MKPIKEKLISKLNLMPHPEGGYYREIYRSDRLFKDKDGERNIATSIYYLLAEDQVSVWHQLRSDEIWYFHSGCPVLVYLIHPSGNAEIITLGVDVENGHHPQIIIPAGTVFGAELSDKSSCALFGCMVAPGFDFNDFTMLKKEDLQRRFPEHSGIIMKLVRPDR